MDDPLEPVLTAQFQGRATAWLRAFSAVCVGTALLSPLTGESGFLFAILLPFAHCPVFWAALFIRSMPNPWMNKSSVYIKENYPEIWKKLHPWGDYSYNSFTSFAFLSGRYDDGGDRHLQLIKERLRRQVRLLIWPFALILICWLIAVPIYFAFGFEPSP